MSSASSIADLTPSPSLGSLPGDGAPPGLLDAARRGETRIDATVVNKVAAQAVREIDNATGSSRRILGISLGSTDQHTSAVVKARVDDDTAVVELTMTVIYPASVQQVTNRTRQHLRQRVEELTGIIVQEVHITVPGMRIARPDASRVQ